MLGCELVVTVPDVVAAPLKAPVNVVALTFPAFTLPEILAVVANTVLFAIKLLAMMLPVSVTEALSPPVVKKLMYPEGPGAR